MHLLPTNITEPNHAVFHKYSYVLFVPSLCAIRHSYDAVNHVMPYHHTRHAILRAHQTTHVPCLRHRITQVLHNGITDNASHQIIVPVGFKLIHITWQWLHDLQSINPNVSHHHFTHSFTPYALIHDPKCFQHCAINLFQTTFALFVFIYPYFFIFTQSHVYKYTARKKQEQKKTKKNIRKRGGNKKEGGNQMEQLHCCVV